MNKLELLKAHTHSYLNKDELLRSKICGCFRCMKIFKPSEVLWWPEDIDDHNSNGYTAACPYCNIDAIIGDASGYAITFDFLTKMQEHWFNIDAYIEKISKQHDCF